MPCNSKTGNLHITIVGGYGYRNAGDEAQLASNLSRWRKYSPGCTFTILSPDPEYTRELHGEKDTDISPASRIVWFDAHKNTVYFTNDNLFRRKFRQISLWNRFAARLAISRSPFVVFRSTSEACLHGVLRSSDVLFVSGGGFLTGSTPSRLWDNMLLMQIAAIYGVPVLLSGQTLGLVDPEDRESLSLVRRTMKIPALVYTRDSDMSVRAAREWGVPDERLVAGVDDALFSPAADLDEINAVTNAGLSQGDYIVLNVHYWGSTRAESEHIIKKIAFVCDYISRKYSLETVLLAMSPVDDQALEDVRLMMQTHAIRPDFRHNPRLIRGVIGNARICMAMKHHPIIFALGERVPCLAFFSNDYYLQKNAGALKLFDMTRFLVDVESTSTDDLQSKTDELLIHHEGIVKNLGEQLERYKVFDGEIIRRWLNS